MASNVNLIERAVLMREGYFSLDGALMVNTGASTGRSTKERFVVRHPELEDEIDWGRNQPISSEFGQKFFEALQSRVLKKDDGDQFSMQGFVGCFPIKVNSKSPWHIAFARNMFRRVPVHSLADQVAR